MSSVVSGIGTNFAALGIQGLFHGGNAGGTANAITITVPNVTAYAQGQIFTFIASADNTGATSLNVNGLGARNVQFNLRPLIPGDIIGTRTYAVVLDDNPYFSLLNTHNRGGMPIITVTSTSQTINMNTIYIANNASLVTFTLPATGSGLSKVGDKVKILGKGAGLFAIAQNATQTIHFNVKDTTTGTGGSVTSINRYAAITIECITADTDFIVSGSEDSFTVV